MGHVEVDDGVLLRWKGVKGPWRSMCGHEAGIELVDRGIEIMVPKVDIECFLCPPFSSSARVLVASSFVRH